MKQLTGKTANETKERFFKEQNGICKLCGRELDSDVMKNHLDHDHALDGPNAGRVRGLLCCLCNSTEGRIKHRFARSGLASRDVDYIEWLENLLKYLKDDYSQNDYHPNFVSDTIKSFGRLSRSEMFLEMASRNYECEPSDTKSELINKFSKLFRKEQRAL